MLKTRTKRGSRDATKDLAGLRHRFIGAVYRGRHTRDPALSGLPLHRAAVQRVDGCRLPGETPYDRAGRDPVYPARGGLRGGSLDIGSSEARRAHHRSHAARIRAAKSTTVRVLRALVDPAVEPLRALPKNERDLAIAAGNAWVLAFDNLSGIRDQLSDALCRLATGGGFATRILYTDDEEIIFSAKRPIILNGIDDIATRGDLQERSLLVSLPSIPEERRVEEAAFWAARRLSPPQTTPQARNPSPWRWPASSRSLGSLCGPCGGWSRRSGSRRRLWPSRAQHRWPSWWRKVSSRCSNLCATCIGF